MIKINSKVISKSHKTAISPLSKAIGLMFRTRVKEPLVFIFKKEAIIPLHMMFVFMPIDVIYLDKNKKIVEIKENFLPFAYYRPKNIAQYFIEFKKGTVKKHNIRINQKTKF